MASTPWSKLPALDETSLGQLWIRDDHLRRLDIHLMPAIKKRRWTAGELAEYCAAKRRLRFIDDALVGRWLEDSEQRGLVCPGSELRRGDEPVWQVTDRGRGHGLLSKFGAAVGVASAVVGILAGALGENAEPLAIGAFLFGVLLIGAYLLGAGVGDRSHKIKKAIVAREREVQLASARAPADKDGTQPRVPPSPPSGAQPGPRRR